MTSQIEKFISQFSGAKQTFLHGCCYWFAFMLYCEFGLCIMYEPVEGHFLAAESPDYLSIEHLTELPCCTNLYDVRGDVTSFYAHSELYGIDWLRKHEPRWYASLMRDCRHFREPVEE